MKTKNFWMMFKHKNEIFSEPKQAHGIKP